MARICPTVGECQHGNTRRAVPPDGGDTLRRLCLDCHAWQIDTVWMVWNTGARAWGIPLDGDGGPFMLAPPCSGCGEGIVLETGPDGLCCACRLERRDTLPDCKHKNRERAAPESKFRAFIESWRCLDCGAVKGSGRSRWRRPDLDTMAETEREADAIAVLTATGDGAIG